MRKPVRVLHVLANLRPGGAERMAVHIVKNLNQQKFEAAVVSQSGPCGSDLEKLLAQDRIPVLYLDKKPGFDYRTFHRLYRAIRDFAPDVLHTHVHVLRYALPVMTILRVPTTLHTVNNVAEYEVEPRARWMQKLAFKTGVVPVAVAQEVALSLTRLYDIPPCRVIANCVPTELYAHPQTPRAEWRIKEGFGNEDVLFVCVARLSPQKNHAMLIEAFARTARANPTTHLLLAGAGALQDQLKESVRNLDLLGRVHFLGLRTDIPDLLAASDVFVLASDYEGNPLSVIEAMAAGLPIVSTIAGGVPELVAHGREGLLVKPGDVDAFSQAMAGLMKDPGSRKSMGVNAWRRAIENFDVSTMVAAYEDLYDQLVNRTRARESADLKSKISVSAPN